MAKSDMGAWLTEDALKRIGEWAAGKSDAALAKSMGVSVRTLRAWAERDARIAGAISGGRDQLTRELEDALVRRALGFKTVEVRRANGRAAPDVETEKFVPPDVRALTFYLTNRVPERWKLKGATPENRPKSGPDPLVDALTKSVLTVFGEGEEDVGTLGSAQAPLTRCRRVSRDIVP